MKAAKTFTVLILLILSRLISANELDEISKCYNAYINSLADGNAMLAVGLVSQATIDHYSKARELALTSNKENLKTYSLSTQLLVLTLRLRLNRSELQGLNGRTLFMASIKNGWVSKSSVANARLDDITVSGNKAHAGYFNRGKPTNKKLVFSKEANVWKFDLISAMSDADKVLKAYAQRSKISEEEMIGVLVERSTGQKVTAALWNGF